VDRYNLAGRLDRWVIAAAFSWMKRNLPNLPDVDRFFINLSGDTLGDRELAHHVVQSLRESDISPERIGFEITEAAAINNLTRANQLIAELRKLGISFALDDFGAGMSSFAYLKALTVDYLKIDGMFIANLADDPVNFEMVSAINRIGHVMGKRTVAECVEQTGVLEKLRELGVDYAQGFALGLPVPIDELLLKRSAPLRMHGG
jgi:EAL domain-containing protein (putative c-di-GMP-specific phosphodiesterase class I)